MKKSVTEVTRGVGGAEGRQWMTTQVLYQGCSRAGRPTGDGDRGFCVNEL